MNKVISYIASRTVYRINLIPIMFFYRYLVLLGANCISAMFFWKKKLRIAGVIEDLDSYDEKTTSGIEVLSRLQAEVYAHPVPHVVDEPVHEKFLKESFCNPNIFLCKLQNASFIGDMAFALTRDEKLLMESSKVFSGLKKLHPVNAIPFYPVQVFFSGTTAVLSQVGQDNYFHWLFEILPKLYLLRDESVNIDQYLSSSRHDFQRDSLELAGLDMKKIVAIGKGQIARCEKALVVTKTKSVSSWRCDYLRQLFKSCMINSIVPGCRIYLTRSNCSRRHVRNEKQVVDLLYDYGFQVVDPANMPIKEQAALFSRAECIVSPHGGSLSNIVFSNRRAKVIELFSPGYVNCCFWEIASFLGIEYHYIIGTGRRFLKSDPLLLFSDMHIDIAILEKTLHKAGVT